MGDQVFPLERSWYIGNAMFAIIYGLQMSMYFQSVYFLYNGKGSTRSKIFYIGYSTILMILITIALAANLFYGQAMWIEHRDFDDGEGLSGPVGYFLSNIAIWYNTWGTASDVVADFMADGLMLYRCYIFWGHLPWVMIFPTLIYLGSVGTISSSFHSQTTAQFPNQPWGSRLPSSITVNFGIPWLGTSFFLRIRRSSNAPKVLTIVFNILVTGMIVGRLLFMHEKGKRILASETSKRYTGLVAILVESALPFTLLGIVYLGLYIKDVPESLALADIWGGVVALAPQAIILRVAAGVRMDARDVHAYPFGHRAGSSRECSDRDRAGPRSQISGLIFSGLMKNTFDDMYVLQ
ncbi:hypothetical protein FB45DRAFT_819909 [Roridomyces roridus]|uniref:Uncharacterized protein n=1 Tax=Roridomyces roridus TaxID=1738132 RepID=A0AAD7G1E7_9AGAR|nr:hypothetical protein FB45DRAFT_819909 [Roridomyces roridus]